VRTKIWIISIALDPSILSNLQVKFLNKCMYILVCLISATSPQVLWRLSSVAKTYYLSWLRHFEALIWRNSGIPFEKVEVCIHATSLSIVYFITSREINIYNYPPIAPSLHDHLPITFGQLQGSFPQNLTPRQALMFILSLLAALILQ
jgi:hypothetical protein